MATTCQLLGLYPQPLDLPAPPAGAAYAVYQLAGFSESGIHAFIRLVPALAPAMANSQLPLDKVEGVAQLVATISNYITTKKIDEVEILELIESIRQLI